MQTRKWVNNRGATFWVRICRWSSNPSGAVVRILQILLFGAPLSSLILAEKGNTNILQNLVHLDGVLKHLSAKPHESASKSNKELNQFTGRQLNLFDVKVHVESGIVKLESGHFIANHKEYYDFLSGANYASLRKLTKKAHEYIAHNCITLPRQEFYYHFMLEVLPNIILMKNLIPDTYILTVQNQPKFVMECLHRLNICLIFPEEDVVSVKELTVITKKTKIDEFDIEVVTDFFKSKQTRIPSKKLVLLRGENIRAGYELEIQICDFLEPHGFVPVLPGKMTVSDQAMLFSEATHVVSLHGGALTNLIFCQKETRVFEIFNNEWRSMCFKEMAQLLCFNYSYSDSEFVSKLNDWLATS